MEFELKKDTHTQISESYTNFKLEELIRKVPFFSDSTRDSDTNDQV